MYRRIEWNRSPFIVSVLVTGAVEFLVSVVGRRKKQVLISGFDIALRLILGGPGSRHFYWKSLIGVIVVMFVNKKVRIVTSFDVV